jgi:hypothetical protein
LNAEPPDDASALIALIAREPESDAVTVHFAGWISDRVELHAPELARYEIANALTRKVSHGEVQADDLPGENHDHQRCLATKAKMIAETRPLQSTQPSYSSQCAEGHACAASASTAADSSSAGSSNTREIVAPLLPRCPFPACPG